MNNSQHPYKYLFMIGILITWTLTLNTQAQTAPNNDHIKTIRIIVGYGPGGGYDGYARLIARHFGRFMPNTPNVIVQNMPGAGSLIAANYIYTSAPRDGSEFGTFARNVPLLSLFNTNKKITFDARQFTWLGSSSSFANDAYLLFVNKSSSFTSALSLTSNHKDELVLGGTSEGSPGHDVPLLLQKAFSFNLKLINGFPDGNSLFLAAERREIDGRMVDYSSVKSSKPDWLTKESSMHPILQFGRTTRHPDLPDVPTALELVQTERQKKLIELGQVIFRLSRCFAAPPKVPADKAAQLQDAFIKTHNDPQFLADAQKLNLDISPATSQEILSIINYVEHSPDDLRNELEALLTSGG